MKAQLFFQWVKSLIKPAWAPSSVFVILIIAYNVFRVYDTHPLFDIPMHFAAVLLWRIS